MFGGQMPVRIRAWDGTVTGPDDAPTVEIRHPDALKRLVYAPGELGLAWFALRRIYLSQAAVM